MKTLVEDSTVIATFLGHKKFETHDVLPDFDRGNYDRKIVRKTIGGVVVIDNFAP